MSESSNSNGLGFMSVLFLIFLTLKLTHVIDWAWIWIFAPIWGTIGLAIFLAVIGGIIVAIADN